jgi:UDP-N-acetylmuramate dehydrogenase
LFENADCAFAYRDSYFKKEGKGKYFITHVYLRLKRPPHALSLEYGAILDTLKKMGAGRPDIRSVSQAVVAIRNSKLPDPLHLGNAGSFFKNPELPMSYLETLRSVVAEPVYYDLGDGRIKVPAGWLIEQCGWKGSRRGDVGCYDRQALVLVNYGHATGAELWTFAQDIKNSVGEKFGIELEPEVNVI